MDGDRKGWQRPLALESLHRIVSSTDLVKWMTESFDCRPNSTHVLEQVAIGLSTVVQQCLVCTTFSSGTFEIFLRCKNTVTGLRMKTKDVAIPIF